MVVIRIIRSRWRGAFAVLALLPWGVGLPLVAVVFGLDTAVGEGGLLELTVAAVSGAASVAFVPSQARTVQALFARPRITLEPDALVVDDPVLLGEPARIRRELIAGAEPLDWTDVMIQHLAEYDVTELSPYREPLNVQIVLSGDHGFASARQRTSGTWIWLAARRWDRSPRLPEPGHRYRRIRLRADDPAGAVAAITEWAATTVTS
jgi:hypothetical protein